MKFPWIKKKSWRDEPNERFRVIMAFLFDNTDYFDWQTDTSIGSFYYICKRYPIDIGKAILCKNFLYAYSLDKIYHTITIEKDNITMPIASDEIYAKSFYNEIEAKVKEGNKNLQEKTITSIFEKVNDYNETKNGV